MEKITSFTIDHIRLIPGVYVSRKDPVGDSVITTFDLRMTNPNEEPVMNTAEMHAMEHLGATLLKKPSSLRFQNHLFRAYGMPYWLLPAACG